MFMHMMVFDFGATITSNGVQEVRDLILTSLTPTVKIGFFAFIIAFGLSIFTAILSSHYVKNSLNLLTLIVLSIPVVVAAPMVLYFFSFKWHILPIMWSDTSITSYIAPVGILALIYWAYFHRIAAAATHEFMSTPFYKTLIVKQVPLRYRLIHLLKHISISLSGIAGPAMAGLLTGSIVIEKVFHVPGVARYFVSSALSHDFPLLLGTVYLYALMIVFFNIIADLALIILDPRTAIGGPR